MVQFMLINSPLMLKFVVVIICFENSSLMLHCIAMLAELCKTLLKLFSFFSSFL